VTPFINNLAKIERRRFLKLVLGISSGLSVPTLTACNKNGTATEPENKTADWPPNTKPDENGLLLPPGFTSRIIAQSGKRPVANIDLLWHAAPDGGGTISTEDGGWLYISSSEVKHKKGGVNVLQFDGSGKPINAYNILKNTSRNCAGCTTPWNTWLSCEEVRDGRVWECDPFGKIKPVVHPLLGTFNHESAIVDPKTQQIYLTEDQPDSGFYRFTSNTLHNKSRPDLSSGILEIAEIIDIGTGKIKWHVIPDPEAKQTPTRRQISQSFKFNGGEGICIRDAIVYFTTKNDNRIWAYDTAEQKITIYYDANTHPNPILTGVDTIIPAPNGDLVIAEDGGNMQVVALSPKNTLKPIVQIVGHAKSEVTGIAFNPSGQRLYFNSQRGITGRSKDAITYEIMGPFHLDF
jgi:hypothetical protein